MIERSPYLPEKRKRHRRGKRGGRKLREKLLAKLNQSMIDPEKVLALRGRLALLTRKAS